MPDLHKLLDLPGVDLMNDHAAFDRVVQAICLDIGVSYLEGVTRFQQAWESQRQTGPANVARVLSAIHGVTLEAVSSDLKLLDSREGQVARTLDAALEPLRDEPVDSLGRVHLAADTDRYELGHDPAVRAKRLKRARQVAPRFRDADGERRFHEEDHLHLEAGLDLVRTLERPVQLAAAREQASTVGRELDAAYADARGPRERVKQLDAEIARLVGERAAAATAATVPVPGDEAAATVKLLEQGAAAGRLLSVGVQLRIMELAQGAVTYEQARDQAVREAGPGRVFADEVDVHGRDVKLLEDGAGAGNPLTPAVTPTAADSPAEAHREAETKAVHDYMREHGVDFAVAVKAVHGIDLGTVGR